MEPVRTATPDDLAAVVDTAVRSLDGEAMLRWSFGEDRFQDRIRRHFTHYDGENLRHGWIRVAADGAAIAVWIPPDAREVYETIGPTPPGDPDAILGERADHHETFWSWVGAHEPDEAILYLSHIGVAPERQGTGLGTTLMRDGIATADREAIPIWLETSKSRNAAYYEGFGFSTVVDEDAPGGGPHVWFMRRDPS